MVKLLFGCQKMNILIFHMQNNIPEGKGAAFRKLAKLELVE